MVNFDLCEEQAALQDRANKFVKNETIPVAVEYDKLGKFPMNVYQKMHELGLINTSVLEEYGGEVICNEQKIKNKTVIKKSKDHLEQININASGIDIGAKSHYVAVPKGRDPEGQNVRIFSTFTADLHELADWLKLCNIDTVAMEFTGAYWIPLFEILDKQSFDVCLVDSNNTINSRGRRSNVLRCQWIQQLHTYGLLPRASISGNQIYELYELRSYRRQRAMLISYSSHHIRHMQKVLELMNIKLGQVINDIKGVTGMKIIRSIISGERNPKKLAGLRDPRCNSDEAAIAKALEGNFRSEHLFVLKQAVELYDFYKKQIIECETRIQNHRSRCYPHRRH